MNAIAGTDIQIRGSPAPGTLGFGPHTMRPTGETAGVRDPGIPTEEPEVTPKEVEQAAEGVNAFLKSSGSHVQFAYHQEAKRMVVEVIDDRTQEIVKTIPAKELLDLSAKIGEMVGLFMDKRG